MISVGDCCFCYVVNCLWFIICSGSVWVVLGVKVLIGVMWKRVLFVVGLGVWDGCVCI